MRPTNRDVFATGGRDGRLLVFDALLDAGRARNEDAVSFAEEGGSVRAQGAHAGVGRRSRLHSVTSAAFDNGGDVLLSSGGSDGLVKMWDLRQMKSAIGALEDAGDDEYVRGSVSRRGSRWSFRRRRRHTRRWQASERHLRHRDRDPTSSRRRRRRGQSHGDIRRERPQREADSTLCRSSIDVVLRQAVLFPGRRSRRVRIARPRSAHLERRPPSEASIRLKGHTAGVVRALVETSRRIGVMRRRRRDQTLARRSFPSVRGIAAAGVRQASIETDHASANPSCARSRRRRVFRRRLATSPATQSIARIDPDSVSR